MEYCIIKWICKILLEYVIIKLYGIIKWMIRIKEICIIVIIMVFIMFMWMCIIKYVSCDGKGIGLSFLNFKFDLGLCYFNFFYFLYRFLEIYIIYF